MPTRPREYKECWGEMAFPGQPGWRFRWRADNPVVPAASFYAIFREWD